jgi:DNA repair protein RecN (Recombination protein N)
MLVELKVQNLALIRELRLSLGPGANILTGETGAGKSVLAGALALLRGAKGSPGLIRAGAEEAKVEALFHLERPEALKALFEELDLPMGEELVIQRSLGHSGRSRARVNGAMATVAQLAALGDELLAVSGQHDQQSLVRESRQLDFLDAFGGLSDLLKEAAAAWREREAADKVRQEIGRELEIAGERRDLIEWHLSEIDRVKPRPGEDEELADIKAGLKSSARLAKTLEAADDILAGQKSAEDGVIERLSKLSRLLERSAQLDERLAPLVDTALECASRAQDIAESLAKLARSLPKGAGDPESIDDRLSDLAKLKRKHGPSLEDVLRKASEMRAALSRMDQAGQLLNKARKDYDKAVERCGAAALALRAARKKAAEALAGSLVATLKVLGFPKLTLAIEVSPVEGGGPPGEAAGPKGADAVAFLFCPNPGEGLKPLSKIASGGELSRVMMALKIAQEPRSDQSLLFDEIDSGLSGATAEAVSAKMAELAARQQILVITHLPQMASLKGKHFLVYKEQVGSGDRTETSIAELDEPGRTMELARMLDGAAPSPEAMALSKRLLNL